MTQSLRYSLLDPTGNITLLVETSVPEEQQPQIAKELMLLEPDAEQIGFVSFGPNTVNLRMAGGEFCGNASMSAAVLYLMRRNLKAGTIAVCVFGTPEPVRVTVSRQPDGAWNGSVCMPRPLSVGRETLPDGKKLPMVRFPGITHVIPEESMERETAEKLAPEWCRELNADALGLMFLNPEKDSLSPLVWVPAAETLFWESSCASGTTAVGVYLAEETGKHVNLRLRQPGGMLTIDADPDGTPVLSGTVRMLRDAAIT